MGYYNGAYLRPLNVDIRAEPAPQDPAIRDALAWLRARPELFVDGQAGSVKDSNVQATVELRSLRNAEGFAALFDSEFAAEGRLQLTRSQHSFDICLAKTCKTRVVRAVAENLGDRTRQSCASATAAGQRLAAANCAFSGARGLFQCHGPRVARMVLDDKLDDTLLQLDLFEHR